MAEKEKKEEKKKEKKPGILEVLGYKPTELRKQLILFFAIGIAVLILLIFLKSKNQPTSTPRVEEKKTETEAIPKELATSRIPDIYAPKPVAIPPLTQEGAPGETSTQNNEELNAALAAPILVVAPKAREAEPPDEKKQEMMQAQIMEQVDKRIQAERAAWESSHLPVPARDGYVITQGTIIPATLWTGINSDLPGYASAIVRSNIYDSIKGEALLIPQGAKLFGQYGTGVQYGYDRILTAWTRILFPDGTSFNIEGMPATDAEGYSGMKDKVNSHTLKLIAGALLSATFQAFSTLGSAQWGDDDHGGGYGYGAEAQEQAQSEFANELSDAGDMWAQKMLNRPPTIVIRPGHRFNIAVTKDVRLPPYGQTLQKEYDKAIHPYERPYERGTLIQQTKEPSLQ